MRLKIAKDFFIKNSTYILIAFAVFIVLGLIVIFLLKSRDQGLPDSDGGNVPVEVDDPDYPDEAKDIDSKFLLARQPLGYHKNYRIRLGEVLSEISNYQDQSYYGFSLLEVNHLSWVTDFLTGMGKGNLSYNEMNPFAGDDSLSVYYWDQGEDFVSYDVNKDLLVFRFSNPVKITGLELNASNEESFLSDLNKLSGRYFSEDFQYRIDNISRQGGDYRVEYSRLLNSIPVYLMEQETYLVVSSSGELKEGTFLLAEFQEYSGISYSLIPGGDLNRQISLMEFPKTVEFDLLDKALDSKYEPYTYKVYADHFLQSGTIQVDSVDVVYAYMNKSQEGLFPTFLFKGRGELDVEGELSLANFVVLANALEPEYVYIHPDSHFKILEGL